MLNGPPSPKAPLAYPLRTHCDRMAILIDAAAYYGQLARALGEARHSVLIAGWEFDSRIRLVRDEDGADPSLGALLRRITAERKDLKIHILVWNPALIYSLEREPLALLKHSWLNDRRLVFRLDDSHPLGASHHQKIVVIDDRLAFIGGIDLASRRWDTPAHASDDLRRTDPGNALYEPFHDIQAMVSGEAARLLGGVLRQRWRNASGRRLPPPPPLPGDPWPRGSGWDIEDAAVTLVRTQPAWEGEPAIREVEDSFLAMIRQARRSIYVENQYFASRMVALALARRMGRDPPEIAVVTTGFPGGFFERSTMATARARLQAWLGEKVGVRGLSFYAPMIGTHSLKVHSKLMIVDDDILRIGSANLNNRSMGLDTECDLIVEANGNGAIERAIATIRARLLAEHLGAEPGAVAASVTASGLHRTIEALAATHRHLAPLPCESGVAGGLPEIEFYDPDRPVEAVLAAAAGRHAEPARRGLLTRFACGIAALSLLVMLAALPALGFGQPVFPGPLGDALTEIQGHPAAPPLLAGLIMLLGLTGLPIFLTVVGAGVLYGSWLGGLVSLAGIMASAAFTYAAGRLLGRDAVRRLTGRRASRVSRALAHHGMAGMALLRIVPIASFTAINLIAGAGKLRLRAFAGGSALGVLPMIAGCSLFGERLALLLHRPDEAHAAMLWAALVAAAALATWFLARIWRGAAPSMLIDAVPGE